MLRRETKPRIRRTAGIRVAEFSRAMARRCPALLRGSDRSSSGQSLVETALLLPVLLTLLFNAVNFGYFFLVALNMAAAPRSGVVYSIQGSSSPASGPLPSAGPSSTAATVSYLTYQDMTGALYSPASTPVQVCSQAIGLNNTGASTQAAKCTAFGGTYSFSAATSDPESPSFVLNQVEVAYTFSPLINGSVFNLFVLAAPVCSSTGGSVSCTFHRQVLMRAMN
jgi:Flp pilus assembly protein TadG